jgi:putative nucleotidyltransferase with HDIG domain
MIYDSKTNIVFWDELLKIPEFKALSETPQNILWHKEGDAFTHTCMVTKCMLKHIENSNEVLFQDMDYRNILIFAALLHDIGKPVTTKKGEDGLYHCKDHAIKGVPIAEHILDVYVSDIKPQYKRAILSLVRCHMQPLYILKQRDIKSAILRLVNNLEYIDFEALLLLKKCDCEGSIPESDDHHEETLRSVRELYYEVCSYPAQTKVWIEKLKDTNTCNYKPGCHPNGINKGYLTQGYLSLPITVGFRTCLGFRFSTSPVTKIVDKNHFHTQNSVYKITEVKDSEL